jgi:uncharacterized membrane protein HdeD (DUF308 family)
MDRAMGRGYAAWLVIRGVVAVVFGIVAVVWPGLTVLALALLFGAYALVDGAGMLIESFRLHHATNRRAAYLAAGLVGAAAGILTLVWPGITVLVLVVMIGIWAIVTGALDIFAATQQRRGDWLLALVGVLSLVAGVLVLLRPSVGAIAIAQVIGVYALVSGVLILVDVWRARRTPGQRPAPAGV